MGKGSFTLVENRHATAGNSHNLVTQQVDVHALHAVPLNVNLARSPERVEMPLRGCFGTRSTGKAAMNCVLFQRLSAMRMFLIEESYVPARISRK